MAGMGALEGKVAVITGASRGIGAAIAWRMVCEGARVVGVSRSGECAHDALASSDRLVSIAGDVTSRGTAPRVMAAAVSQFGPPEILVNNAGVDLAKPLADTTPDEARNQFDVHVVGALLMIQAALPWLRERRGAVVNVTSRLAKIGVAQMAVYGAAKGGLLALTLGAAVELAPYGIRVNAVAPGMTDTDLLREWVASRPDPEAARREVAAAVPQGELATPDDVAAAVIFLASDSARHITGVNLPVDGGYTAA